MSLKRANAQALLDVSDIRALRFVNVYGYVGEIKYFQEDSDTPITCKAPAVVQDAVKIWRRYGSLRVDALDRCAYVRILAFARTAAFGDDQSIALSSGDPISGMAEAANCVHAAAQMSGWMPASASERKLRPPARSPMRDSGPTAARYLVYPLCLRRMSRISDCRMCRMRGCMATKSTGTWAHF